MGRTMPGGLARRAFDAWLEVWWEWSPVVTRLALTAVVAAVYWPAAGPGALAPIALIGFIWVAGR